MKEIKILVASAAGAGKSTVCHLIYKTLLDAGFNVDLDVSGSDFDNADDFVEHFDKGFSDRVEAVKHSRHITVSEIQLNKELTPGLKD